MGTTPFLIALGCVASNLLFFGPQTTTSMTERRRVCKELGVDRKSLDPRVRGRHRSNVIFAVVSCAVFFVAHFGVYLVEFFTVLCGVS